MTELPPDPPPASFRVRWTTLSWALGLGLLGALGTLVFVVTTKEIDILSTLAIGLAILAFGAQLVIALVQITASSQQIASSERINTEAQSALAALNGTSEGLLRQIDQHFSTVLHAAIDRRSEARRSAANDESDEDLSEDAGQESFKNSSSPFDVMSSFQKAAAFADATRVPEPKVEPDPLVDQILSYPSKSEGLLAIEKFETLGPWEVGFFIEFSRVLLGQGRRGRTPGLWAKSEWRDKDFVRYVSMPSLIEKGLIRTSYELHSDGSEKKQLKLTLAGAHVASLILARGPSPQWLKEHLFAK